MGEAVVIAAVRDSPTAFSGAATPPITVPSFDGALKPNQKLRIRRDLADMRGAGGSRHRRRRNLFIADGRRLLSSNGGTASEVRSFERPISALCALPGGGLAVALGGTRGAALREPLGRAAKRDVRRGAFNAVNALALAGDGTLIATDGSSDMRRRRLGARPDGLNRTGRVFRLDPGRQDRDTLAQGLGHAFGACALWQCVLVSESWRHRLVPVAPGGTAADRARLTFPSIPRGLSKAARRRLLAHRLHRAHAADRVRAARAGLPAPHDGGDRSELLGCPAPALGLSFKEPMQGAHIKTMGVIKPWAPPRSYGLVIRLDADGQPLYSLHSRVDGAITASSRRSRWAAISS